jgi:hypothetical protein
MEGKEKNKKIEDRRGADAGRNVDVKCKEQV